MQQNFMEIGIVYKFTKQSVTRMTSDTLVKVQSGTTVFH